MSKRNAKRAAAQAAAKPKADPHIEADAAEGGAAADTHAEKASGRARPGGSSEAPAGSAAPATAEPRPVPTDLAGSGMTCDEAAQRVGVASEEVFAFRAYGTHVVVVTIDGRKLTDAQAEQ